MNKYERKILEGIEKNMFLLFAAVILAAGLYGRYAWIGCESGDYETFLMPWFMQLKDNGGFRGMDPAMGNYNLPYMGILAALTYIPGGVKPLYLIKAVSVVFDVFLAVGAGNLTYEITKNKVQSVLAASVIWLLPTVQLNGACWAQCDSIYVSFLIWSLWALVKDRKNTSFLLFGAAFAFKLQAVFLLPVFLYVYFLKRDFSIVRFVFLCLIPNFVLSIPGFMAGCPLLSVISVYGGQTQYYSEVAMNIPNIYCLIATTVPYWGPVFMGICILGWGGVMLYAVSVKAKLTPRLLLTLTLWSVAWAVFLLPHMHDRYLYFADALSVVWFFAHKKRLYIPICINLISLSCYIPFLFGYDAMDEKLLSLVYLAVVAALFREVAEGLREGRTPAAEAV